MQSITLLSEQQCESICGGYGYKSWGDFIKISTKSYSTVDNNVSQKNTAFNFGGGGSSWGYSRKGGGLGMLSSISNLQANAADLVSVVL
jgi:hypothetical protein